MVEKLYYIFYYDFNYTKNLNFNLLPFVLNDQIQKYMGTSLIFPLHSQINKLSQALCSNFRWETKVKHFYYYISNGWMNGWLVGWLDV